MILGMVKKCIKTVVSHMPLKNIIIFESSPSLSDNAYWFFKYLVEREHIQDKYKLVWFVTDDKSKRLTLLGIDIVCINVNSTLFIEKLKRYYYTIFSKFIIDSNVCVHKINKKQIRIYLTHGMPIKNIDEYLIDNYDFDLIPVTAEFFKSYFDKQPGFGAVEVLGSPRNDVFENSNKDTEHISIVWLPTYRQHANVSHMSVQNLFPLGLPVLKNKNDFGIVNKYLKEKNAFLYFRPHPAQDLSLIDFDECTNIILADDSFLENNGLTLYELLSVSSALITDYSSVYIDYLLLDRPIALTLEDVDIYTEKWPLIINDIDVNLPAQRVNTVEDLKMFISNVVIGEDVYKEERKRLCKKYNEVLDFKASENIYKYMKQHFNF